MSNKSFWDCRDHLLHEQRSAKENQKNILHFYNKFTKFSCLFTLVCMHFNHLVQNGSIISLL